MKQQASINTNIHGVLRKSYQNLTLSKEKILSLQNAHNLISIYMSSKNKKAFCIIQELEFVY